MKIILRQNDIAKINFSGAVRSAIEELDLEVQLCAVEVAKCYRTPPLVKDVISATAFLVRVLDDDWRDANPMGRFFFPTCEAFGFDPSEFGYVGKNYEKKIKNWKEARERALSASHGLSGLKEG